MPVWMLSGLLLALATALPLAWKWQLGVLRATTWIVALSAAVGSLVRALQDVVALSGTAAALAVWFLSVGAAVMLLAYRFYRDPDRQPPDRDDVIVSPADGVVIYVRRSEAGVLPVSDKHGRRYPLAELTKTNLPSQDAVTIGIAMNFADVHVNRAPCQGEVTFSRRFPGRFGSLRHPEMEFENERATTVITRTDLEVAVVQIASRLVRQISVFVKQGQQIAMGERLGVIRFGSQVDVVLPMRRDVRVTSQVGERVRAGESIIAVIEKPSADRLIPSVSPRTKAKRPLGALVIAEACRGLGLVRSLGRKGIPVWTLEPAGERLSSCSRYSCRHFRWPAAQADQIGFLFDLAARHQLDGWAIYPTDDETTATLSRHHAELATRFRMTVPPWNVLSRAHDKHLTYALASDIALDHPRTYRAGNRDAVRALQCTFPLVLKPAFKKTQNRFTCDKAWRVEDRDELLRRYDEAVELAGAEAIVIQELIPGGGDTQFSFAALCEAGRVLASVTARRARQYPIEFGHSSSQVETIQHPVIEQLGRRLLAAMEYSGLAEVEFKYDRRDGRYKLLDVNPRVWTWHTLCAAAGVDFPYLLWQSINGNPPCDLRGRPGVRWVRMSTDVAAAMSELASGRLSIRQYAASLRPPLQLSTFALDDPIPSLVGIPMTSASRIKRLFAGPGDSGTKRCQSLACSS